VEGQTEAAFATNVLMPHLANFNVFLYWPRFTGLHRRRRGPDSQGGLLTRSSRLRRHADVVEGGQSADARFSMMVDCIRCHDFPAYAAGLAIPTDGKRPTPSSSRWRRRWR